MSGEANTQDDSAARIAPTPVLRAPWRISAVTVLADYRLAVTLMDGRSGVADCASVVTSKNPGIYASLADPEFFSQVHIELGALTWPNGAGFDPAWLYDNLADGKSWPVP